MLGWKNCPHCSGSGERCGESGIEKCYAIPPNDYNPEEKKDRPKPSSNRRKRLRGRRR